MALIPGVAEAARRLSVPDSIIAATLVAFGTSLPELVTAIKASIRGHGELAVGNVIGADILNVLFVAGAAAAVTPGGLLAGPQFFKILFPAMVFILLVFRVGVIFSGKAMKRSFGIVLAYCVCFRDVGQLHWLGLRSGGALSEEIRRSEFSAGDKELGRPELTPLGKCTGAVELEIVP